MKLIFNRNLQLSKINVVIMRSSHPMFEPRVIKTVASLQEEKIPAAIIGLDRKTSPKSSSQRLNCPLYMFRMKTPVGTASIAAFLPIWWSYVFVIVLMTGGMVVHACDLDALIPALLLKIFTRKKIVYDIFDFYADRLPEDSFLRKAISFLDKIFARFADVIILADDLRVEQVKGMKAKRCVIIYNSPSFISETANYKKVSNEFTLFYCGTIDFQRGIVNVAQAVEGLQGVKLVLAGYSGRHYKNLLSFIGKYNNTMFIGPLSYDKVLELTHHADALFALYDPAVPNYRYASPNKLFEAMMCGKPIIVSNNTLMARRVIEHDCGIVVDYDDVQSIREAILCLKENPNFARKLGENGKRAYREFYDWSLMKRRIIKIYKQILAR